MHAHTLPFTLVRNTLNLIKTAANENSKVTNKVFQEKNKLNFLVLFKDPLLCIKNHCFVHQVTLSGICKQITQVSSYHYLILAKLEVIRQICICWYCKYTNLLSK